MPLMLRTAADQSREEERMLEDLKTWASTERKLLEDIHLMPDSDDLERIMRYDAHLSRQLYQALHELEALQARGRGDAVSVARLDINGIPEALAGVHETLGRLKRSRRAPHIARALAPGTSEPPQ